MVRTIFRSSCTILLAAFLAVPSTAHGFVMTPPVRQIGMLEISAQALEPAEAFFQTTLGRRTYWVRSTAFLLLMFPGLVRAQTYIQPSFVNPTQLLKTYPFIRRIAAPAALFASFPGLVGFTSGSLIATAGVGFIVFVIGFILWRLHLHSLAAVKPFGSLSDPTPIARETSSLSIWNRITANPKSTQIVLTLAAAPSEITLAQWALEAEVSEEDVLALVNDLGTLIKVHPTREGSFYRLTPDLVTTIDRWDVRELNAARRRITIMKAAALQAERPFEKSMSIRTPDWQNADERNDKAAVHARMILDWFNETPMDFNKKTKVGTISGPTNLQSSHQLTGPVPVLEYAVQVEAELATLVKKAEKSMRVIEEFDDDASTREELKGSPTHPLLFTLYIESQFLEDDRAIFTLFLKNELLPESHISPAPPAMKAAA